MSELRYKGETTDIRAWLNANRPELVAAPKGKLKSEAIAAYREAHSDAEEPEPGELDEPILLPAEIEPERLGEAKRSWLSRKVAPKTQPKRPARRTPIDGVLALAYTGFAHIFSYNPATIPVSRCMAIQAPAAGMVLEEALKGSIVDKMLQPIARTGKRGEAIWGVIGPPILVGAISARPELYPVLRPVLRESFSSWIVLAGPKIRKAQEREAKLMAELDGDLTTIDAMIDAIFAPDMEAPDGAYATTAAAAA